MMIVTLIEEKKKQIIIKVITSYGNKMAINKKYIIQIIYFYNKTNKKK